MPVEDPGYLDVTCDRCEAAESMETAEFAGDPVSWGVDDATIEGYGWIRRYGDNCTYCPKCKDHLDDEDDDDE